MTSAVASTPVACAARSASTGLAGGDVEQVERAALVRGERQVALDHEALGDGRVAGEPDFSRDRALVHLPECDGVSSSQCTAIFGPP